MESIPSKIELNGSEKFQCLVIGGGGNKGIIVLNIDLDNNSVNGDITLKKDGISKIITIPSDNIEILNELKGKTSGYNIVFDSNGNMVYENLAAGTVYESIHKLITR